MGRGPLVTPVVDRCSLCQQSIERGEIEGLIVSAHHIDQSRCIALCPTCAFGVAVGILSTGGPNWVTKIVLSACNVNPNLTATLGGGDPLVALRGDLVGKN